MWHLFERNTFKIKTKCIFFQTTYNFSKLFMYHCKQNWRKGLKNFCWFCSLAVNCIANLFSLKWRHWWEWFEFAIAKFSSYNEYCTQRHLTSVVYNFQSHIWLVIVSYCFSLAIFHKQKMENEENKSSSSSRYDLRKSNKRSYKEDTSSASSSDDRFPGVPRVKMVRKGSNSSDSETISVGTEVCATYPQMPGNVDHTHS